MCCVQFIPRVCSVAGIAPHGLIGQTADGDDYAVDGAQDNLGELAKSSEKGPGGLYPVHPTAQGEGAIEGTIEDYYLPSVFETKFKCSHAHSLMPTPACPAHTRTRRAARMWELHTAYCSTPLCDVQVLSL